ncbi:MAG: hypothetical protein P1V13_24390 [Rhizobiaceae bacterium]|nr:hypothetical protein [Rhizobiaceae bacterium]
MDAYTHYPHMDIKLVGTVPTFIHRDHLSSVRIVTDASGNLVEETAYAASGEPTNAAMTTQKGTINERHDPETGLMYLNARTMSPQSAGSSHPMTGTRSRKASGRTVMPMPRTIRRKGVIRTGIRWLTTGCVEEEIRIRMEG